MAGDLKLWALENAGMWTLVTIPVNHLQWRWPRLVLERYLAKAILVSPAKFSSAEGAQAMVISAGMSVSIRGDLHGVSDSGRRPVG